MTILYKLTNERPRDHALREYKWCMYQMERCYMLQDMRRRTKDGAAVFYQLEARRWHILAMRCRARYKSYIPGTDVQWDKIFPPPTDKSWDSGRGQRIPLSDLLQPVPNHFWDRATKNVIEPKTSRRHRSDADQRGRRGYDTAIGGQMPTPAEKYNNPRDVPLTLTEQMLDLIDGIGTKRK